jgi:hypothetical protein
MNEAEEFRKPDTGYRKEPWWFWAAAAKFSIFSGFWSIVLRLWIGVPPTCLWFFISLLFAWVTLIFWDSWRGRREDKELRRRFEANQQISEAGSRKSEREEEGAP